MWEARGRPKSTVDVDDGLLLCDVLYRRQRHKNGPKIAVSAVVMGIDDPEDAVGSASVGRDLEGRPISTVDVDEGLVVTWCCFVGESNSGGTKD